MAFTSIPPPSATRPQSENRRQSRTAASLSLLKLNFSLPTLLLIGAFLQTLLILLLPARYALPISAVLLTLKLLDSSTIALGLRPNPAMAGVIQDKVTAIPPGPDGTYSSGEAVGSNNGGGGKVVIFVLGFKSNHPFGFFAPGFRETGHYFTKMCEDLDKNAKGNGFLGQTSWSSTTDTGSPQVMNISYWRSKEAVHAFAHAAVHAEGWAWWNRTVKQHAHLGILHEVFESERGAWENVYKGFRPTGLGGVSVWREGEGVGDGKEGEWVSPLLSAREGRLASDLGRLGGGRKEGASTE